jgi:putative ABC transport system ATP-binding protein
MELLAANAVRPERAVIVVTHDARVFRYAHSIAHMDDGCIVNTTRRDEASRAEDGHALAGTQTEIFA